MTWPEQLLLKLSRAMGSIRRLQKSAPVADPERSAGRSTQAASVREYTHHAPHRLCLPAVEMVHFERGGPSGPVVGMAHFESAARYLLTVWRLMPVSLEMRRILHPRCPNSLTV
jgi:hypothetical protein